MSQRIYLEYTPAARDWLPDHWYGHFYLSLRDQETPLDQLNDDSLAIRGGGNIFNDPLVVVADVPILETRDAFESGETPADRGSQDITDLILTSGGFGQDGDSVIRAWEELSTFAAGPMIGDTRTGGFNGHYTYQTPSNSNDERQVVTNSGAVILSVLNYVGIDLRDLVDTSDDAVFSQGFPGATIHDGTLLGSGSDPHIFASDGLSLPARNRDVVT